MNTADLQLQGLLLAVSSLIEAARKKGLLTETEILDALNDAERRIQPTGHAELSAANVDAIHFPIRFLRLATNYSEGQLPSFAEITAAVGQTKPS